MIIVAVSRDDDYADKTSPERVVIPVGAVFL
jgi:hypothetical protein